MDAKGLRLPASMPVSGTSFRQEELRDLVEGDLLDIVAVDDNTHDPDAIEVRTRAGVLVGFVPKALAPRLRASGGERWVAHLDDVLRNQTWGLRITVHPAGTELSSARERRAAAIARGNANSGTNSDVAVEPVLPAAAVVEDDSAGDVIEVVSPSGRVLGVLAGDDGDRVVVRGANGETTYPRHVVALRTRQP